MQSKKSRQDQRQDQTKFNEFGKIPPQAVELEEAVLGSLLLEKSAIEKVVEFLKPEMFYKDQHAKIYDAILELYKNNQPIDLHTVANQLTKNKELESIGGKYRLIELTGHVATAANIVFHSKIIQQRAIARELIQIGSVIQERAFDETEDVKDILDEVEKKICEVATGAIQKDFKNLDRLVDEAVSRYDEISKMKNELRGEPSGFTAIDRVTHGLCPSDLIIIAARPSMGKTAFALSMARNMAIDFNRKIGFFSLEMSSYQLTNRLINQELMVSESQICKNFDQDLIENKLKNFRTAGIFIDDTPSLSMVEFKSKARRMKSKHGIQAIFFDYIQLATAQSEHKGSNREQEISTISRTLKSIAKELNIPVIALSQLSRDVEKRGGGKRPILSDLRESGAIEQDADIVMFIHRPEYYGQETFDGGTISTAGKAEIIIAKHRNGPLGNPYLDFIKEFAKFTDWSDVPY